MSTQSITPRDAALILGCLDLYAKGTAAVSKSARAVAASDYFRPGERTTIVDPLDDRRTLGKVWMTDPRPVAEVENPRALTDYLAAEDPESTYLQRSIRPDVMDEVLDVLERHAPGLLADPVPTPKPWALAAALAAAVKGELSPGIEVRTRPGTITVKLDEGAAERYRELVAGGHVDPLRELPAAARDEQTEGAA